MHVLRNMVEAVRSGGFVLDLQPAADVVEESKRKLPPGHTRSEIIPDAVLDAMDERDRRPEPYDGSRFIR